MTYQHNFNSGPAALFEEVKQQAIKAIENFENTGISILEYGHRTKLMEQMIAETVLLTKKHMQLGDDFEVIYLAGGATVQGHQIPMNFLNSGQCAAYVDSGIWSMEAVLGAQKFGDIRVVASSKERNYNYIPKNFDIPKNAKYLHITMNNTAFGTQWSEIPDFPLPLIADMTSDICSRPVDFKKCSLIYAGAQKNIGAAGCTMLAIRKDFLAEQVSNKPARMFDYQQHITHKSMVNTPPVFPIYVCLLTLRHLDALGGLSFIGAYNQRKADLLYGTLEKLPIFMLSAEKEDRSRMNVCFKAINNELEKELLAEADKAGIFGIAGHRAVGGFRVALYNAVKFESVQFLCDLLEDFARRKS